MRFLFLILLLSSFSAIANVDLKLVLDVNEKLILIQNQDLAFDKEVSTSKNDFEIKYTVSKKIPKDIPVADYNNNQKSILFNISVLKDGKEIIKNAKVVTIYGHEAILEIKNLEMVTKIKLTANETFEEKRKRISSIRRLPVYTESAFLVNYQPIENVKRELEKIISKNGKIKIDKDTNSIIVKDTLEKIIEVNNKFESIDI